MLPTRSTRTDVWGQRRSLSPLLDVLRGVETPGVPYRSGVRADDRGAGAQPSRCSPDGPRRHPVGCSCRKAPGLPATPRPSMPPRASLGPCASRPPLSIVTRGPGGADGGHRRRWPPPVTPRPDFRDADVRAEECTMSTAGIQPKLQVAFAGTFAARLEQPVRAYLRLPYDVIADDEAGIVSRLSDVDVLVTMAFTREMSRAATRLKLVQVPGAGLDRIDRSVLPAGAWLANVYGHETGIAEYVLGAMLTMSRDFARLDAALRRGIWESQWAVGVPPPPVWPELAGKTLGILGYGRIGQCVARRARTFDMEICAIRRDVARSAADELALLGGLEIVDEVLQRSDYLVISLPVTPGTHGLIGKKQLHAMKPTAVLVNVSRAEIIDEEALYRALAARTARRYRRETN